MFSGGCFGGGFGARFTAFYGGFQGGVLGVFWGVLGVFEVKRGVLGGSWWKSRKGGYFEKSEWGWKGVQGISEC